MLRGALDDGDLVDAVRVAVDVEGVEGVGPGAPVDLVSLSANATRLKESEIQTAGRKKRFLGRAWERERGK